MWRCHNGKCGKKGNIISLLTLKGYKRSEAERMVMSGAVEVDDLVTLLTEIMGETKGEAASQDWVGVDPNQFWMADKAAGNPAREYMNGRGIGDEAFDFFLMGYAKKKDMAVVPVFDERSTLVGVIGRELKTKTYRYSTGLGRGQLIWNINNARQYDSVVLTEGALDAVYLWQAGYKNSGAVLGSAISPNQWVQIRKYHSDVTCFFDNDDAGIALTEHVITQAKDLSVWFVEYPDRLISYTDKEGNEQTRPIKDPGELTQEEIEFMMNNRKSSLELYF